MATVVAGKCAIGSKSLDFFARVKILRLVLEKTVFYSDIQALCDIFTVFDSDGAKTYYIYQSFFSPDSIRSELEENGFRIEAIRSNLWGERYRGSSPEIGVICRNA